MRMVLRSSELSGQLDCHAGITPLQGGRPVGGYLIANLRANDFANEVFKCENGIVIERVRASLGNAIGLRTGNETPLEFGIGTLSSPDEASASISKLVWRKLPFIQEWVPVDELVSFRESENKALYLFFSKEPSVRYDVAQIDEELHGRPVTLSIEAEISISDRGT